MTEHSSIERAQRPTTLGRKISERKYMTELSRTPRSSQHAQAKQMARFSRGIPVTKEEIRSFQLHEASVRTSLATKMWIERAMDDLPLSHPRQAIYEERLRSEPAIPPSPSHSIISIQSERKPVSFLDLPQEVRATVYKFCLVDCTETVPSTPDLSSSPADPRDTSEAPGTGSPHYPQSGLRTLYAVFPTLKDEIKLMLATFYRANTFHFDLRGEKGCEDLQKWIRENEDEASCARKISLKHWTWWFSSGDWHHTADETVLTLTPASHIKLTRQQHGAAPSPHVCDCAMTDFLGAQCPGWKMNRPWSALDFVLALREPDELLIQAVRHFVALVRRHDRTFPALREVPPSCDACGKGLFFLRSLEDGADCGADD